MTWWTDIRFALRGLRRDPGFTAFAILTLALGFGANAAIFTLVDGVLLKPLPYPRSEQLVVLSGMSAAASRQSASVPEFAEWQQAASFQSMAASYGEVRKLTGVGEPRMINAWRVTADYFGVLGVGPALGRGFSTADDQPGNERVVILGHELWQRRFGADPDVLGRPMVLDGPLGTVAQYTIVGVLPKAREFDRGWGEIWLPAALEPGTSARDVRYLNVIGRLKPGIGLAQARAEMATIAARIDSELPDREKGWSGSVDPIADWLIDKPLRTSLTVLMAAVGAILMIGCANLANLLLARSATRGREFALRSALGASRGRLVRQLLVESVTLSLLGCAAGLALGYALLHVVLGLLPPSPFAAEFDVRFDGRAMAFLAALAPFTAVFFGLIPAVQASGRSGAELTAGPRATHGSRTRWFRHVLVGAEIALAFILLVGAGVLLRSFDRLTHIDLGFDATDVVTMDVPMVVSPADDGSRITAYLDRLLEEIRSTPGVRQAAFTSALPLQGGDAASFGIEGSAEAARPRRSRFKVVTPGYFDGLGITVSEGRSISQADVSGSIPVATVNESFARRYFPDVDPIGKRLLVGRIATDRGGDAVLLQIVGVVTNENAWLKDGPDSPSIYVPFAQYPVGEVSLLVKGTGHGPITKAIQGAVWRVDKEQALTNVRALGDIHSEMLAPDRLRTVALGLFAGLALVLATIGSYGVLSYVAAQRTQELGVRAALGASSSDLVRLVIGGAAIPIGTGIIAGLGGALAASRMLSGILYETSPTDPATLMAVGVTLVAVALAACYIPARRAARVDPMVALRHD